MLSGWAWSGMLNSCGCGDFEVPRLDAASAKADSGFGSGLSGKVYLLQGGGSGPLGVFSLPCMDTSLQAGRGCKKKKVEANSSATVHVAGVLLGLGCLGAGGDRRLAAALVSFRCSTCLFDGCSTIV